MANLKGNERGEYVQAMFSRIAKRYDLMNRIMTAGQDIAWRKEVIDRAELTKGARILDLGSGTGDIAMEARQRYPGCSVVAADFTLAMMQIGRQHPGKREVVWSGADALHLPFAAESFNAVVSGFLMRNVSDIKQAMSEQWRVLKPGGRLVILDTTRPQQNIFTPFIRLHLGVIIPTLGKLITGQPDAYRYLPETTSGFLRAEELAARIEETGFIQVNFRRRMFDTIAIHWAAKPAS